MRVGSKIKLVRRNSGINGWSCAKHLDGAVVEILKIEDRINGGITVKLPDGSHGYIFRDAVGCEVKDDR